MKKVNLYFVFGGAVSAGAYTAGAIDQFMRSLYAYYELEESERLYDIKIKAIAGTSAGGMCGSIFLHNLAEGYTRKALDSDLYKTWVENIDISLLSSLSDLDNETRPKALLNGKVLRDLADDVFGKIPVRTEIEKCPFLDSECRIILSVTDTVGKSYEIDFVNDKKEKSYFITNHREYYRFTLSNPSDNEIELNEKTSWDHLKEVSLATGAFPIGLPPIPLGRPASVYDKNEYGLGKPFNIKKPDHKYWAIDGGIGDNEPFGQLVGLLDNDNKAGIETAVIFIDPFPSSSEYKADEDLSDQFSRLYTALRNQSAFKPREVLEFRNKKYTCYSIIPKYSKPRKNNIHLAGSAMSAFSGFVHKKFRSFDYQLGIWNSQKFLQDHFPYFAALPKDVGGNEPEWPTISLSEYKKLIRVLDKRLARVASSLIGGRFGSVSDLLIRWSKKPSKFLLEKLKEIDLVD